MRLMLYVNESFIQQDGAGSAHLADDWIRDVDDSLVTPEPPKIMKSIPTKIEFHPKAAQNLVCTPTEI